jgi:hypothetical protein
VLSRVTHSPARPQHANAAAPTTWPRAPRKQGRDGVLRLLAPAASGHALVVRGASSLLEPHKEHRAAPGLLSAARSACKNAAENGIKPTNANPRPLASQNQ